MYYLYGAKRDVPRKLVATFDSEQQLLAYVRWATLAQQDGVRKFEQGSALAGYQEWSESPEPLTDDDPTACPTIHRPACCDRSRRHACCSISTFQSQNRFSKLGVSGYCDGLNQSRENRIKKPRRPPASPGTQSGSKRGLRLSIRRIRDRR